VTHNQLGAIYYDAGDLDRALSHYRDSIRYNEVAGNLYSAALTRYNVALVLIRSGRFVDALDYANAALHNYETYGEGAAEKIQKTRNLIAQIEKALQAQGD
jgi:tetratricopeptide (TPR) repeat protein